MIRINLLAVERERARRRASFQLAEKMTLVCSLVLVAAAVFIGWWYWSITRQASELDANIEAAQRENNRLQLIIQQVGQAEQRRTQLQQRVALIEQLRKGQSASVHLLDEVSRAMPEGLWLTSLTEKGTEVSLEGRSLTLNSLSELISNIEASPYFKKPVEGTTIDTEKSEPNGAGDLIKFSFRVQFAPPSS